MATVLQNTTEPDAAQSRAMLEEVYDRYGFDFRDYSQPSLRRRIEGILRAEKLESIAALRERLRDPAAMERFLAAVTVHVTAMFRDPGFYLALRTKVLPRLRTYPFVRIWVAGCSTGEEVYSLAILLREEGLYRRCRIYATDLSEVVLEKAKAGIFPLASMQQDTANYQQAGGRQPFSEYYTARYGHAILDPSLRENVVFARHCLATDASFNEFHLVLCRNVMIYFGDALTGRVHRLIYESLALPGYLGLGSRESLRLTPYTDCYEEIDARERIYRRIR